MRSADDIRAAVRAGGLLAPGEPVLVLLSGGRDSTCLLDLAVALAGPVAALHVDYGLRPESGEDADHCRVLCDRLAVPLTLDQPAGAPAGNLQAWARAARYAAADRIAATRGGVIAAGHTASDQAETVLYRLAASPGRRALLGMAPRDVRLVRPLLGVTREETAAYCRERGLPWREDATNASDAYARNRVRHQLLPALRAVHPAAEENVRRTADLLREEAAVLNELVAGVLDGRAEIEVERLAALPPALARLVVRRLAEDALGAAVPRAVRRTPDVIALGAEGALDLGDGARARVRAGILRFEATPAPPAAGRQPAGIPAKPDE
ncbi:MAG TPA: tRNA lysidine(34) synthetase TilS [Solirubrobacteraceae bacterium]|jgi:tRNA(Ile)-lysidine synthase|nr:tRNA lysidine(34) synthetase TilS [Solirubrobacteraceae bacterium]